ncbi:MAG: CdvA-like protein [Desulfurococcaceae archaeon]|nr:CdvA-like protein [Desulfurococcaceae archaeon]
MVCETIEKVTECLNKPVVDPYGRRLGFIVSYYSNSDGKVYALEVNFNDTNYKEIPIERFTTSVEGIVLIPEHEYNAMLVENRIRIVKSRIASLEDLYSRKEIPVHVYEQFKKRLEEELTKLKSLAREVKEALRKRIHEIEDLIAEVEKSMSVLKTSYLAGEISEKPYLDALGSMKKSLEILMKEKDSLKKHIDAIESLEALPLAPAISAKQPEKTPIPTQQSQPVQVVVVE